MTSSFRLMSTLEPRVEVTSGPVVAGGKIDISVVFFATVERRRIDPVFIEGLEVDEALAIHADGARDVLSVVHPGSDGIPKRSVVVGVSIASPVGRIEPIRVPLVARYELAVLPGPRVGYGIGIHVAPRRIPVCRPVEGLVEVVPVVPVVVEQVVVAPVAEQRRRTVFVISDADAVQIGNGANASQGADLAHALDGTRAGQADHRPSTVDRVVRHRALVPLRQLASDART